LREEVKNSAAIQEAKILAKKFGKEAIQTLEIIATEPRYVDNIRQLVTSVTDFDM